MFCSCFVSKLCFTIFISELCFYFFFLRHVLQFVTLRPYYWFILYQESQFTDELKPDEVCRTASVDEVILAPRENGCAHLAKHVKQAAIC